MYMVHCGIVGDFLILLVDSIGCDQLRVLIGGGHPVVERFLTGLLKRKVGTIGHLLGLVVLL